MDFSEIGVKSRKTGIRAKENVKRDANNMEDVDDFFKDDQTLIHGPDDYEQQQLKHQPSTSSRTFTNPSSPQKLQNGRIIFPSNIRLSRPNSTSAEKVQNSPLRSPLRSKPSREVEDDLFTDAYEQPMQLDSNIVNKEDDGDDDDDMEIDDDYDGYGNISLHEDDERNRVPIHQSPKRSAGGEMLLVSSDEEENGMHKSKEQRQLELERNTTVRSSSNRSLLKPYSLSSTPKPLFVQDNDFNLDDGNHEMNPLLTHESPLRSVLNSPLQLSSKKIASISKNMVLNKNRPQVQYISDNESLSEVEDNQEEYENYQEEEGDTIRFSDEDKPRSYNNRKRQILSPKKSTNGRQNKFQRSAITSPVNRQHVIDVNQLRRQQSRSQSNNGQVTEQPTRRSSRVRIPPLAFWRNERAVYEKTKDEALPTLKEIITVDAPPESTRSRTGSRATSRATSRRPSKTRNNTFARPKLNSLAEEEEDDDVQKKVNDDYDDDDNVEESDEDDEPLYKPTRKRPQDRDRQRARQKDIYRERQRDHEIIDSNDLDKDEDDAEERRVQNGELKGSEWLKNGFLKVDTFEGHGSDLKSNRLIAWAPGTENFSNSIVTEQDNFKLAILFDKNREFIAAGMMSIPPRGVKSLKSTDTTYFVFYCISGIVEVTLSGNVFLIKKGCSLEIPMGNFYQFVNRGKKDATLFFVQTRGHDVDEWDEED